MLPIKISSSATLASLGVRVNCSVAAVIVKPDQSIELKSKVPSHLSSTPSPTILPPASLIVKSPEVVIVPGVGRVLPAVRVLVAQISPGAMGMARALPATKKSELSPKTSEIPTALIHELHPWFIKSDTSIMPPLNKQTILTSCLSENSSMPHFPLKEKIYH
jgi:hypothetical protein